MKFSCNTMKFFQVFHLIKWLEISKWPWRGYHSQKKQTNSKQQEKWIGRWFSGCWLCFNKIFVPDNKSFLCVRSSALMLILMLYTLSMCVWVLHKSVIILDRHNNEPKRYIRSVKGMASFRFEPISWMPTKKRENNWPMHSKHTKLRCVSCILYLWK